MNIHWKRWCQSWSSNTLAYWWEELTHWKRPWGWERLRAKGEGDDRGWDGWMASPTQWTWVWPNSARWWRTQTPYMLQSMGSQRVRHNLATARQQHIPLIKPASVKLRWGWELRETWTSRWVRLKDMCGNNHRLTSSRFLIGLPRKTQHMDQYNRWESTWSGNWSSIFWIIVMNKM